MTILFADRTDRIVMSVSTSDFIGNWSIGVDSFAVDSPSAVLVVDKTERAQQYVTIVELFNPVYDVNKNALKYDVTQDNSTLIDMYVEFGKNTIVIDPGGPWDPSQ